MDEKAEELLNAITALRMIPNKDALKDLIGKAEAVNTSKYTACLLYTSAPGICACIYQWASRGRED